MTLGLNSPTPAPAFTALGSPRGPLSNAFREGRYPLVPKPVQQLIDAEDYLDEQHSRLQGDRIETYAALCSRLTGDLVAGDLDEQTNLSAILEDCLAQNERDRLLANLIGHLRLNLNHRWTKVLRGVADDVLAAMHARLGEIVAETRDAAVRLNGLDVSDPDAVAGANRDQLRAANDLKELRTRYADLRRSQEMFLNALDLGVVRTAIRDGLTTYAEVAALGKVREDLGSTLWFTPLLDRDDAWIPTLTQLLGEPDPPPLAAGTPAWHDGPGNPAAVGATAKTMGAVLGAH